MEKKNRNYARGRLENVVNILLATKERDEYINCDFEGHESHSDNITMDFAYIEVLGYTKKMVDALNKANKKLKQ